MTFGQLIAEARRKRGLKQKELAALVKKEDGKPISNPYLNDIERDRRNPPSDFIVKELAKHLEMEADVLCYWSGRLPENVRARTVSEKKIMAAFKAFRKELLGR
jgi:transcriptional regulator with XRE-family HTH domain